MRKILSWVLLACLILTMIPVSILADDAQTPSTTEPALKTVPEGATPLATLADLYVDADEAATFAGDFYLPADLYITLDMVDDLFAEEGVDMTDIANRATTVKDANGDVIYYTADGKIAYDTTNGVTKAILDAEGNATGEFEKDANGDVVYYKKPASELDALTNIAYDSVNGTYKRAYSFASPLITTDKGYAKNAETGLNETNDSWEKNLNGYVAIYGCGHSLTFEEGIDFTGAGVLFNKIFGKVSVYDLSIGTAEKPVLFNTSFANVGILAGGIESHSLTFGEGETAEKVGFATIVTLDNVDVYGDIYDLRVNNNNIGGLVGKPNHAESEIHILNCNTHINISTAGAKKAGHGSQYGGVVGTWLGGKLVIENTNAYGDILADVGGETVGGGASGGLVGITTSAAVESIIEIRNCNNYGSVKHSRVAGGLLGNAACNVLIENCTNYGAISQEDDTKSELATAAAGLVGRAVKGVLTLKDCKNETSNIIVTSPNPQAVTSGLIGVIDTKIEGDVEVPVAEITMENVFSFCDADINLINGASIRFDAPTDLQFKAQLSATLTYEKLVELYGEANITIGIVYAPLADVEAAGGFDGLETAVKVVGEWADDAKTTFVATTNAIDAANYGTKYVASAYVTIKDAQGVEDTIYSFVKAETARSVSDVAKAALADVMPTKMDIPSAGMHYVYKIDNGVWSKYTPAGCEKLQSYVVEEPAPQEPAPAPEA